MQIQNFKFPTYRYKNQYENSLKITLLKLKTNFTMNNKEKNKKKINKNNEIFIISNIERKNNIEFQTTHKLILQVDNTPDQKCPQEVGVATSTYIPVLLHSWIKCYIQKKSRFSDIINAVNYSASSVASSAPFFPRYSLFPRASFSQGGEA